jgi:hypothetical protein
MTVNTQRGQVRTPRGRPFATAGPFAGVQGASGRVAWLLRVNRLLGPNPDLVRTSAFAAAFKGGSFPRSVSESTVSRWETASAQATFSTVRRYEELLGLAEGALVAPADTLHRYTSPHARPAPVLSRHRSTEPGSAPYREIEELLELARSTAAMSGADWDRLTSMLAVQPSLMLVPSRLWTDLSARLLEEMVVSGGQAWMQRSEALHRLLGHPVGQAAAVAACTDLVGDATSQVFIEPMAVLDASAHPEASRHVLNQLTRPLNARSQYGALLACVRKLRDGHFTPDQLKVLAAVLPELLRQENAHPQAGALVLELVRRLPTTLRTGADRRLPPGLAPGPRRAIADHLAGLAARPVIGRIVRATTIAPVRETPGFADELLPTVVEEMLFAPVLAVQLHAALLIRATPYRPAVAAALGAELANPRVIVDTPLACALLLSLGAMGDVGQRPIAERLAVAPGLRPEVAGAAITCLAHIGGTSSDRFWRNALALHGRAWRRHRSRAGGDALAMLVYGLGIARNGKLLAQVRADGEAPGPVRAAASWWLGRSARLYASIDS